MGLIYLVLFLLAPLAHAGAWRVGTPAHSPDVDWTLNALAPDTGRYSGVIDLRPVLRTPFFVTCRFLLQGTRVPGSAINLYWRQVVPGDMYEGGMMTNAGRDQMFVLYTLPVGMRMDGVVEATFVASFPWPRIQLGVWNATTVPLATASRWQGCTLSW
jgi:hypothetical protein